MVKPNIIYILADDMGYGDISCLNEKAGFQTPELDRLCRESMRFSDAHASSAVCTPSRYSILTGRYCWRSMLKRDVLKGYDIPIIEDGRTTVASFLQEKGYKTYCIGKWHLGLNYTLKDENDKYSVDYEKPLIKGPTDFGFDYFYGIPTSLDMPPYVYIENKKIDGVPDRVTGNWWNKGNSYNKEIFREGPTGSNFHHHEVLDNFTDRALNIINENKDNPFFLYFPLTAPHTPILPSPKFKGKSGTNAYGDFVLMCDDIVGKINSRIKELGIEENTIIIFTSDNGCSPRADYPELAQYGHNPSYVFRGTKFDIFDGGHRVPFIVKWKNKIKENVMNDKTICLMDLFATVKGLFGETLLDNEGEDSVSNLPVWLSDNDYRIEDYREALVHHSVNGSFSIRKGNMKLILCPDSGGKSDPLPGDTPAHYPKMQLYNMDSDVRERVNLINEKPEIKDELLRVMIGYMKNGRSTPGKPQKHTPANASFEAQVYS